MTKYQGYIDRIKALEAELEQAKKVKPYCLSCGGSIPYLKNEYNCECEVFALKAQLAAKPKMTREEIIQIIDESLARTINRENKGLMDLHTTVWIKDVATAILSALSAGSEGE